MKAFSIKSATFFGLCAAVLVVAGCTKAGPTTQKVTGTVTMDGKPLSGATVTFNPVAGGTGSPATGIADENGVYTVSDMKSDNIGGGAVAGEYKVSVMWYKPSKDTSKATGMSGGGEESMVADAKSAQNVAGPDSLLPAPYQNPETSGLTYTVVVGTNTFDIPLDSKFKGAK